MLIKLNRYPKPFISSEYINIYKPSEDFYNGPDSLCFKNGEYYEKWITNDFTIIKANDKKWHMFGITHPAPNNFISDFEYDSDNLHDAEWQLFHAVTEKNQIKDLLYEGSFRDREKILYPQERPGQDNECWAPCAIKKDNLYYLIYSPHFMRISSSADLFRWKFEASLFEGHPMMRDPYVFEENGIYYMLYIEDHLYYRKSTDLFHWSEPEIFQKNVYSNAAQESPCLFKRNGIYYLMWCICDGLNGSYDNRIFVFAAEKLEDFNGRAPITMLEGHAAEIITDDNINYYILSTFYPQNGVSIAKIDWK